MVLRAKLPKMLIASNFERYDPNHQDRRVSIRVVPKAEHVPGKKNSGKSSTVKFKILASVKKTYKVLIDGGTEAFINHIRVLKTMLVDCKVKVEAVTARSCLLAHRRNIAALTVADRPAN